MEGIFLGQAVDGVFSIDKTKLTFEHERRTHESHSAIRYSDCDYVLVESDDVIKTNDELLKLRDEVKRLTEACNGWEAECNDWKTRYAKVNNELFQKGLAYGMLEGEYKKEKIAGELLLKDRNTLREERDTWKHRWNSVVTDIGESLKANGITFVPKEINGEGNWDVVIDIPELNEAKKKVDDLEKKLAAAKSNETYWRDRKEEEEEYHHYWAHTFNRAVTQAEQKGVYIGVCDNDEEYNAGVVIVDNGKANELESQVVQMEDANQKLRKRISAADEEIERLKGDISAKAKAVIRAEYRGDAWMDAHDKLIRKYHELEQRHDAKWTAMTEALKDKGVEVIYMGEQDGKPIIDIKVPGCDELKRKADARAHQIDILKKELETLKSRTLDNVEIRLSCGDIVWTYCDGFVHVSSGIDGIISADQITAGTIPKCKSCVHYMHNPSRYSHDWCYRPVPKEGGAGYIRKLNKEEVEGPACGDFKARKE